MAFRNRDGLAKPLAILALAFSVFAIGSVHRWSVVGVALLSIISTIPYLGSRRRFSSRPALLVFLAVCGAVTLLQVLPLPQAIVAILSPAKHNLLVANASAMGAELPSFMAISLDPSATLRELVKLVAYLFFAYTCLRLAAKRSRHLLQAVAAIGGVVALLAFAHSTLGLHALYGLYEPEFARSPTLLAPLLNTNHLAGLMALCSSLALGLALHCDGKQRSVWIVCLLLCGGVGVLTESRGGVVALGLGLSLTAIVTIIQKRSRLSSAMGALDKKTTIAQVVVGLCVLTLLAATTGGGVLRELGNTKAEEITGDVGKLELWGASLPIVARHPVLGVGRGAFEPAIARLRFSRLSHASLENEYLQAIVDWGLVGAALASAALVFLVFAALKRWRLGPLEAGAISGLFALAFHSTVDFGLSLPGVALPAIAVLATVTQGQLTPISKGHYLPRIVSILFALAATILLVSQRGTPARAERCGEPCTIERARVIWERHPADYAAAGRVAVALSESSDRRAIPVLNRALSRNPFQWGLHLHGARWLGQSQVREQSMVEYALAVKYAPIPRLVYVLREITEKFSSPDDAAKCLPASPLRLRHFHRHLTNLKRGDVALAHSRRLLALGFESVELFEILSIQANSAKDFALAEEAARRGFELAPSGPSAVRLASTKRINGDPEGALAVIETTLANRTHPLSGLDRLNLLLEQSNVLLLQGKVEEARESLNRALAVRATTKAARAKAHTRRADLEASVGNRNQAEVERNKAKALRSDIRVPQSH
ncbi:MAG: hypothetical protein GY811_18015 [Myxococcales bacterium]|nr:hypothetical protein [Myxococcales bacterium]